jgi:hypothetical protein
VERIGLSGISWSLRIFAHLRHRGAAHSDPGFEDFLAPASYQQLTAAAVGGPVVIVNASRYGCHALIVHARDDQPTVIDLCLA